MTSAGAQFLWYASEVLLRLWKPYLQRDLGYYLRWGTNKYKKDYKGTLVSSTLFDILRGLVKPDRAFLYQKSHMSNQLISHRVGHTIRWWAETCHRVAKVCDSSFLLLDMLIKSTSQQEFHFRLIPPLAIRIGLEPIAELVPRAWSYAGHRLTCGADVITHLRCYHQRFF